MTATALTVASDPSVTTGFWLHPPRRAVVGAPAGAGALMRLADALAGCAEGSEEEIELNAIVNAIEDLRSQAMAARQGTVRLNFSQKPISRP